jgi:hypothetical protein
LLMIKGITISMTKCFYTACSGAKFILILLNISIEKNG